ncbi:MAG: ABC transporter substrate-binding protein [Proteobacteria bacterium]|nr:ABC transporter substrate-binding protein [Pseudomonadota bacterium]
MKLKLLALLGLSLASLLLWLNESPNQRPANQKVVAITQIVDHSSLNAARQGLQDALTEAGYLENKNLKIITQNPQGNLSVAAQVAKSLNQQQVDAVVAISTTSAQTVLAANHSHHPIVFSSVTSPIEAQLVNNLAHPGGDITGTMDLAPQDELMALVHEILPHAKAIGVIYNPGEANSVKGLQMIELSSSLKVIKAPILSSADITQATNSIIQQVDAIILPTDNTVWSALDKLILIAHQHNVPVLTSDPDSVKKGVLLALGYSQYDVGYDAGKKLVRILNGEKPGDIPISVPERTSLYVNATSATDLKIKIPEHILLRAQMI